MKTTYNFYRDLGDNEAELLLSCEYEIPNYPPLPRKDEMVYLELEEEEGTVSFDYYVVDHVEHGFGDVNSLIDIFVIGKNFE